MHFNSSHYYCHYCWKKKCLLCIITSCQTAICLRWCCVVISLHVSCSVKGILEIHNRNCASWKLDFVETSQTDISHNSTCCCVWSFTKAQNKFFGGFVLYVTNAKNTLKEEPRRLKPLPTKDQQSSPYKEMAFSEHSNWN